MADAVTVTKVIEVDVKASAAANQHMKDIADRTKGIEEAANKSGSALSQLTSWVKGFVGFQIFDMIGDKVLAFASALQVVSDSSRQLEERMKLVTGNTESARAAFETIIDISVRQGRELDGVAKLYERVTRSSEQLGVTQKGVSLITEGMAASLRLSGASTQEANAAMLQFSQALASGKLGGDEFRSLMENDTVLMKAFADALGVTMGQFRQMSKDGKLDAETLQKAMLAMGEDGKNVMQRMIEQADHLPKTFAQAVDGIKAATVDVVNAFQQMGDKSEGIFTHIVRSLTKEMRNAAQLLRDQALINEEVAKAIGKKLEPKEEEVPFESKRIKDIQSKKDVAEREFIAAQRAFDLAAQARGGDKNWPESARYKSLTDNINTARGTLTALNKMLAASYEQDVSDTVGGYIAGKAQGTPAKVKKGPHQETDEDFIKKTTLALEQQTREIEGLLSGESKADAKLDEYLMKIDSLKKTLPDSAIKAWADWARGAMNANEEAKKHIEEVKQLNKDAVEENKKELAKNKADLDRELADYRKEHLDKDPFEGAQERINRLWELITDPNVTDEQARILMKQIHAVREKATKQLLGEKDPLKNVADQMADNWKSAFDTMESNLLDFNKSVKDTFKDMVQSVLNSFAKIAMNRAFAGDAETTSKAVGSFFSGILDYFGSANGSAFGPGGVRLFGKGDVVNQPTNFSYNGGRSAGQMGEAGSEAIMPLARDSSGRLGVSTAPVNVIINNNNGSNVKQTQQPNSQGGVDIHVMVDDMVESSLGSGRYDKVMNKAYGVGRRGG